MKQYRSEVFFTLLSDHYIHERTLAALITTFFERHGILTDWTVIQSMEERE